MKEDMPRAREFIMTILISFFVLLILFAGISYIFLQSVDVEAECSVDGLNFNLNETQQLENLSVKDGSIHCYFKGGVPIIIARGSLE